MKQLFLISCLFLMSMTAIAQEKKEKKNKNAQYEIAVAGNCDMCKKRIEKAAYSVKGVKKAQFHADHFDVHLVIDENKCSLDEVKKAIAKAGHDTDTFKADATTYDNLHHCCKYERIE